MSKEQVIENLKRKTNGGFDIFYRLYKDNRTELKYGDNVGMKNILKKSRRNSIHILKKDGEYYFNDGLYKINGDAIKFASLYFKIDIEKDFQKLVNKICGLIDLDCNDIYADVVNNIEKGKESKTNEETQKAKHSKANIASQEIQLKLFDDDYSIQSTKEHKNGGISSVTNNTKIKVENDEKTSNNNGTTKPQDNNGTDDSKLSNDTFKADIKESNNSMFFPTIPDDVYHLLPEILRATTKNFEKKAERDVFFLGCLAVMSAILPNYTYYYHKDTIYCNLYLFIIGTPASGKGTIKQSIKIVNKISTELEEKYSQLLEESKKNGSVPLRNLLILTANASKSSFNKTLKDSDSVIVFETEIDNLINSAKHGWSDLNELFLKGFQHELSGMDRIEGNTHLAVQKPKISLIASTVPQKYKVFVKDVQSGFFSRILYYSLDNDLSIRNVHRSKDDISEKEYNKSINDIDTLLYELNEHLKTRSIEFDLTQEMDQKSLDWLKHNSEKLHMFFGTDTIQMIRRFGVIKTRIAMILSMLSEAEKSNRNFDEIPDKILCSGEIFDASIMIIDNLLCHGINMFKYLKNDFPPYKMQDKGVPYSEHILYEHLPHEFQRKDAIALAKTLGISESNVDKFLSREFFRKTGFGRYKKVL
jgi:molybdopterin converting factor small subunit